VLRALERLPPVVVEPLAIMLVVLDGTQAQLQCGWLQRPEHLTRDQLVQGRRGDMPAGLVQGQPPVFPAIVAGPLVGLVPGRHAAAALATHDQTGQQRLAPLWHAPGLTERPVLAKLLLVCQVAIPRDVRGHSVVQEHGHLFGWYEPPAATDAPRRGVLRPRAVHAVGVRPGVDRVLQDREDPTGRRRSPFQLTYATAALASESQLQIVEDQVTEDGVRGAEFVELLEDQVDHPAGLLVGLPDDLSRGRLQVSQRNVEEQLSTLRLVPAAAEQTVP